MIFPLISNKILEPLVWNTNRFWIEFDLFIKLPSLKRDTKSVD